MVINIRGFLLLTVGVMFCMLGCTRDRGHILMPDDISSPMDVHESADIAKASFEQNVLPILTARCALAGCHVADGPHGLDFRTYESFIAGGEHGPAFIPGNPQESEVVEQIVSGQMPPGGPPLTDAEIQLFVDWINGQEAQDGVIQPEHDDEREDVHDDMDAEHEEDDEHEDGDGHEEMDAEHEEDDEHDEEDDEHEGMDNGHDEDDDDNHEENDNN